MKKTQKGHTQHQRSPSDSVLDRGPLASAGVENVPATVKPASRSNSATKKLTAGTQQPAARVQSKQSVSSTKRSGKRFAENDDMELLLTGKQSQSKMHSASSAVILHIVLLIIGIVGSLTCLWTMLNTSRSEEVAQNLGLVRVANSLENILSLLAYPVLMFLIVLSAYAAQQLYRAYKVANDPDTYSKRFDN